MKVLIDQQFHLGHHYQYLAHLLPALTQMVPEVVVAITAAGRASTEFSSFLTEFTQHVTFMPVLPEASPGVPLNERWRVHQDLREVVRRVRPDYVLIPSGDAQSTLMAPFHLSGLGSVPGRIPCEIGIHFGLGAAATSPKARLKDKAIQMNLALSGARRVHVVNFLFYEAAASSPLWRQRFNLMPHPVPDNPRLSKSESRRLLGLPEAGRYIGLAASIDSRKAIREFLEAFRAATTRADDRLLLAGFVNPTHMRTIDESFGDLIRADRLFVRNGFVSNETYQTVLTALDVVCTPYPVFAGLSSTLLEGLAAGRPVLANKAGWCEAVVDRFGVGWTCDVLDHADFTRAVREALDGSGAYVETEKARRLLAFHSPQNFASTWCNGIGQALGAAPSTVRSWTWACQSLETEMN